MRMLGWILDMRRACGIKERAMNIRGSVGVLVMSGIIAACNSDAATGEKAQGTADQAPFEVPLAVNAKHQRLALGMQVSVGVKDDGTVWSWGTASYGELGTGLRGDRRPVPEKVKGLDEIMEVSGSSYHFLALHKNGTVYSWGMNDRGQLGYQTSENSGSKPRQIDGLNNIVSVSAGYKHSLALDNDGSIYGFGGSESGQLGRNKVADKNQDLGSDSISYLGRIRGAVKVIAGVDGNAVLTGDGRVWFMGHNATGQFGCSGTQSVILEFSLCDMPSVVDVALGAGSTYLLGGDGYVWAMGFNSGGRLGRGFSDQKPHPELAKVSNLSRIVAISSNGALAYALDDRSNLFAWGASAGGPASDMRKRKDWYEPKLVARLIERPIAIVGGDGRSAMLSADGYVNFVGSSKGMIRGIGEIKVAEDDKTWVTPQRSLWMWR